MLTYSYTARDASTGEKIKATLQADSEQSAAKLIKGQGLTPVEIKLAGSTAGVLKFFHRIGSKDKILFSRQLATLINAGLPLIQSLRTVANQTQNKDLKVVINQIISDVEGGSALSVSLSHHPEVFNQVFISMVAAGEASGTLDAALERLSTQQEKDAEVLSKVRGAMIYPLVVLAVMLGVITFMLIKVLPQVQVLYAGLPGAHLPLLTVVLLSISNGIIHFWPFVLAFFGFVAFAMSRWARTLGGKTVIDRFKMHGWPIGPLFMKLYMARFARTSQTLVASGVPLLQVLEITAQAINNVHISDSIHKAMEKVKGGKALSDAITGDTNFLILVPDMLRIGEQSGSMEAMLAKTADYYEKEVDNQIKNISTIIEPVLMIVLGVVAFTIVAAVLIPIYGLAGQSNLGG